MRVGVTARELGWIAGFLEGEGSFTWDGAPYVSVSHVQLEPLERMQRLCGGRVRWRNRATHRNGIHDWRLVGARAAGLMMAMYAMMSPRRRGQIVEALTKWRATRSGAQYRTHCPHGHRYSPENTIRQGRRHPQRVCRTCRNWWRRDRASRRKLGEIRLAGRPRYGASA